MISSTDTVKNMDDLFTDMTAPLPGSDTLRVITSESFKLVTDTILDAAYERGYNDALRELETNVNKMFGR